MSVSYFWKLVSFTLVIGCLLPQAVKAFTPAPSTQQVKYEVVSYLEVECEDGVCSYHCPEGKHCIMTYTHISVPNPLPHVATSQRHFWDGDTKYIPADAFSASAAVVVP